jgi:hypothetical protein
MSAPPPTPAPDPDAPTDEVLAAGMAVLQATREREGQLALAVSRRLRDPRRDPVRDALNLIEGAQQLRTECVRQICAAYAADLARQRAAAEERSIAQRQPPPGGQQTPPPPPITAAPVLRCEACKEAPPADVVVHDKLQPGSTCPVCPVGVLRMDAGGSDV